MDRLPVFGFSLYCMLYRDVQRISVPDGMTREFCYLLELLSAYLVIGPLQTCDGRTISLDSVAQCDCQSSYLIMFIDGHQYFGVNFPLCKHVMAGPFP